MPGLFNPLAKNAFGFPVGTNGEADESKATVQPQARPFVNKPQNFLDDFTARFQGASGGYGAFTSFVKYLSGQGELSIDQNDSKDKPLSRFSIAPGGTFNLQNLQSGFGVTGKPGNKSIGVDIPVNIGGNKGTVGLEGSWNSVDPSIQAKFAFGGEKQSNGSSPEQAVDAALASKDASYTYQAPFNTTSQQDWNVKSDTSKEDMAKSMWFAKGFSDNKSTPSGRALTGLSFVQNFVDQNQMSAGRQLYNQMIPATDSKDNSPTEAIRNYNSDNQFLIRKDSDNQPFQLTKY